MREFASFKSHNRTTGLIAMGSWGAGREGEGGGGGGVGEGEEWGGEGG